MKTPNLNLQNEFDRSFRFYCIECRVGRVLIAFNKPQIYRGSNNGIDGYVGNKEKVRIFENCITLANSGSVGSCFYQPYSFVASDHVTKLENNDFDKYTNLFLSSVVSRLGEKYSFNREMNDTRIKKEKILLPINDKNEPDYEFMENYMKNLEYKRLTEYLKFKSG
ncbi:MAG: restriction endonuclease subunit S [Flavobacteriaceae bacterium]|nr:type II restriction endonuclease subunit S [Formosa sp.]MDG1375030.1 restriction endonuclease subunit S [Flavobacteriaceae bacterium]MDG2498472.1 restriction endonuclease subunit S [Flavobacteriaceae bacterium]